MAHFVPSLRSDIEAYHKKGGPQINEIFLDHQLEAVDAFVLSCLQAMSQKRGWREAGFREESEVATEVDIDPDVVTLWEELLELKKRIGKLERLLLNQKVILSALDNYGEILTTLASRIQRIEASVFSEEPAGGEKEQQSSIAASHLESAGQND